MNLDELSVGVVTALLIQRGLGGPGADHRDGRLAKDGSAATGSNDDGVGGEGADFHGAQIHRADAAADALSIENGGEKFPVLVLFYFAFGLVAAHLLVERVEKLLAGSGSRKSGAVIERASEAAKIEQAFSRAVEGNTHAVEQVDDAGRSLAHGLHRWLIGQKIATVDRVVEMLPGGIAFAFQVFGGVDSALGADGVRALHRDDGEEVDLAAHFGDLDDGGQTGQTSTDDDDFWSCHVCVPCVCRAFRPYGTRSFCRLTHGLRRGLSWSAASRLRFVATFRYISLIHFLSDI